MSSPSAPSGSQDATAEKRPVSGCFWCEGHTDYHPECDRPGCENPTHGFGPDGQSTLSYCNDHREGPA